MQLHQLKQFKAIVEYGSMNEAAKNMYISQSAISQNLDKLEKEIGVKFFHRITGGKMILNDNGVKMLAYVNQILQTEQEIYSAFQKQDYMDTLHLYSGGGRIISALLVDYMASHKNIRFHTSVGPRLEGIKAFLDEKVDILIDDGYIDEPEQFMKAGYEKYISNPKIRDAFCERHNLKSILFYQVQMYLCVPKDSPYAARNRITLKELEAIPIVRGNYNSDFGFWIDELMKYRGINLNIVMTVDNDTFNSMVFQHGYNSLIISSYLLNDARFQTQCKLIFIDDPYTQREFWIYVRKNNQIANTFLQEALTNFDWNLLLSESN